MVEEWLRLSRRPLGKWPCGPKGMPQVEACCPSLLRLGLQRHCTDHCRLPFAGHSAASSSRLKIRIQHRRQDVAQQTGCTEFSAAHQQMLAKLNNILQRGPGQPMQRKPAAYAASSVFVAVLQFTLSGQLSIERAAVSKARMENSSVQCVVA